MVRVLAPCLRGFVGVTDEERRKLDSGVWICEHAVVIGRIEGGEVAMTQSFGDEAE